MKTVIGWLRDPYVHVFAVGLVLVRLSMGGGAGDEPADLASAPTHHCQTCLQAHQPGLDCPPIVVKTTVAAQAD